jgi:hypothetical protein
MTRTQRNALDVIRRQEPFGGETVGFYRREYRISRPTLEALARAGHVSLRSAFNPDDELVDYHEEPRWA